MIINLNATFKARDFGKTFNEKAYSLSVGQGDNLREVMTEDGISTDIMAIVVLTCERSGKQWYHPHYFTGSMVYIEDEETGQSFDFYKNSRSKAEDFLEKIEAKGVINLSLWEQM